jgi:hypothetical protein
MIYILLEISLLTELLAFYLLEFVSFQKEV